MVWTPDIVLVHVLDSVNLTLALAGLGSGSGTLVRASASAVVRVVDDKLVDGGIEQGTRAILDVVHSPQEAGHAVMATDSQNRRALSTG